MSGGVRARVLLAGLAGIGLCISAYLTWAHLSGSAPVCVGGSGGCAAVQASRYSEVLGVPVAALGLLAYAALICAALIRGERAALFGLFVALTGTLYSAYLTYLELFVIREVCQWCVANAAVVAACLGASLLRVRRHVGRPATEG